MSLLGFPQTTSSPSYCSSIACDAKNHLEEKKATRKKDFTWPFFLRRLVAVTLSGVSERTENYSKTGLSWASLPSTLIFCK